jgi:tripartite-type tricarboxylate transporter receptor subunit TctC
MLPLPGVRIAESDGVEQSPANQTGSIRMPIARLLRALLALLVSSVIATASYGEWPQKPIRLVMPFAAGGGASVIVRSVADGMSKVLGQPVVVENRPGADAIIGTALVAKAPPDGYTLLFAGNTALSAAPYLHRNIGYDPVKDFTPISMLGTIPFVLAVNSEVPAKTMRELVEYVRAHPGKVAYGSTSSLGIIVSAQLAKAEKLDMVHVPYKGEAPLMPDLLSNRVQIGFNSPLIAQYVQAGRLRALAAFQEERNDAFPDVPTVAEAGFAGIAIRAWAGIVGPAGLPRDIQAKLSHAVNESLRMESTITALAPLGFRGKGSTPQEMADVIDAQLRVWEQAVRDAGIQPD